MILNFLKKKETLVVGFVIVLCLSLAYSLFFKQPKTITKTEVVTKTVVQVVTKEVIKEVQVKANIATTHTTETKRPDGTTITETTSVLDTSVTNTNSQTTLTNHTQETLVSAKSEKITNQSTYTLGVLYPLPLTVNALKAPFTVSEVQLVGGVRVFNLPVFVNIGTNMHFNQVLVGLTIEF